MEEDLEDLFDRAPCGYVSTEPNGRIRKVNETLLVWLGQSREELVGRRFQDLLNVAGKIYYETHFAPLLRIQGFFNEVALDLVGAGGRALPVLVNAVERRNEAGEVQFLRITIFNASDRRRYERELLAARREAEGATAELRELNRTLEQRIAEAVAERMKVEEQLRHAMKMEAIGRLTGGVAHDFNNLLTIIMGGLETIGFQIERLPSTPITERMQRAASMALHGTERAATLTARLLAFSRRQPLEPKSVDVSRLATGLVDLLQRTLGEQIELQTVCGAGLWRTLVDPAELENALVNLAVNARDAMSDGGRLTIETSNAYLDEAYTETVPEPISPGQYVLLAVSDTGAGMDAATLTRVFEPFFTTKAEGKGTGLGLSHVYGFVRQSGGHIRIYSEPGEGTTVKLYLPRLTAERPAEVAREETAAPRHGGDETVLLVEDNEDVRSYSAGVLREFGYRVLEAPNGPAALRLLDTDDEIDVLVSDVILPEGMNGRQLAEEALRRRPALKVLFTTGYAPNAIIHNGRLEPGLNLLSKPFTSRALIAKLRQVLDR